MLALLYLVALLRFWKNARTARSNSVTVAVFSGVVAISSVFAIFVLSSIVGFPFWGRHLASVLPFVVFSVAVAVDTPIHSGRMAPNRLTVVLGMLLFTSSLLLRFHPDHSRDDYRAAAHLTNVALRDGKNVWWAAAPQTAGYYGVAFCQDGHSGEHPCVVFVENARIKDLSILPAPDVVVLSKPDLFDINGGVQRYLIQENYRVTDSLLAFHVYGTR
jgi:hypothetical protein